MSRLLKRTWAQVDLDKLRRNFEKIKARTSPGTADMAIVKADAYGNGAVTCARELDDAGAAWFGVSNLEEAVQLREAGIIKPILILGYTPPDFADELIRHGVTQAVFSETYAFELSAAAAAAGGRVKAHLAIDTGMSRIGFVFDGSSDAESAQQAARAAALGGIDVSGAFTHFAVSDDPASDFTSVQFSRFTHAADMLRGMGVKLSVCHCCNSAALLLHPEMHLDMVRPGVILYGMVPDPGMPMPVALEPVMELKTVVFQIKQIPSGATVSYGRRFTAAGVTTVATLPIGYADGFSRSLSGRGEVIVNGRRAPIIGRICMDQCMIDISAIPGVHEGSIVTVIGADGGESITIDETAAKTGTINYEISCLIGKRVPRVFMKSGKAVGVQDYFRA